MTSSAGLKSNLEVVNDMPAVVFPKGDDNERRPPNNINEENNIQNITFEKMTNKNHVFNVCFETNTTVAFHIKICILKIGPHADLNPRSKEGCWSHICIYPIHYPYIELNLYFEPAPRKLINTPVNARVVSASSYALS